MLQHSNYILLDAARMGHEINNARARNNANDSLYRGTTQEKLSGVAPYIFQFAWGTTFSNWSMKQGWGKSWGVLLKSAWPMSELHKHFRKFLMVQTESGRQLYFRFYDPRVLRIFLPTCSSAQLREFFGGNAIEYFLLEDDDPAFALRMWHENGFLKTNRIAVDELITSLPDVAPLPQKEDELTPETRAVIEELKKEHPDIIFPGDKPEQPAPAAETADTQGPQSIPAPRVIQPTPSILQSGDATTANQPAKPKTKWNMFD